MLAYADRSSEEYLVLVASVAKLQLISHPEHATGTVLANLKDARHCRNKLLSPQLQILALEGSSDLDPAVRLRYATTCYLAGKSAPVEVPFEIRWGLRRQIAVEYERAGDLPHSLEKYSELYHFTEHVYKTNPIGQKAEVLKFLIVAGKETSGVAHKMNKEDVWRTLDTQIDLYERELANIVY
jgi:hypothetical protein